MLQFVIVPTSEFLYLITNHATDTIQTVIHTINMKFRKLNKNNVRNADKTWQLKQEVLELSSTGIHARVQCRVREQKRFVEIKPVPVVKHVEIWQFILPR